MSFTKFYFFVFFVCVYLLLWVARWSIYKQSKLFLRINKLILLLASYIFTGLINWRFCISLMLITVVIYVDAILIEKRQCEGKPSRGILTLGILAVLLQLGVLKYFNFFVSSISGLLGTDYLAVKILIPTGISFYSLSAISYLVDIFNRKYKPSHEFINIALYISFFPKLTSGPIVRPNKFLEQLSCKHHVSLKNLEKGIQIVLLGLFKKMVVADHLSLFVNDVFKIPNAFTGATCFLAIISYPLQIYFDFSGYSDIAIGISNMLGFDFDKNFDLPFLSMNMTELWKRWHISLSSWLLEYLYYPLGGNRKGKIRMYINLVLTMLVGGLWHGANWTYLVWGVLNGAALGIHKLFMEWKVYKFGSKNAGNILWKVCSTVLTFIFFSAGCVFFGAHSIQNALNIFICLFNKTGISQMFSWSYFAVAVAMIEMAIALWRCKKYNGRVQADYILLDLTKLTHLALFIVFCGITIMLAYVGNTAFIYGRF